MGRPLGSQNKDKRFKAALVRYAEADPTRLDGMAEKLWATAMEGDVSAIREVADRLDGKVPQAIVGDDDHPSVTPFADWLLWMKSPGATGPDNNSPATTSEPNDSPKSLPTAEPEKP